MRSECGRPLGLQCAAKNEERERSGTRRNGTTRPYKCGYHRQNTHPQFIRCRIQKRYQWRFAQTYKHGLYRMDRSAVWRTN